MFYKFFKWYVFSERLETASRALISEKGLEAGKWLFSGWTGLPFEKD